MQVFFNVEKLSEECSIQKKPLKIAMKQDNFYKSAVSNCIQRQRTMLLIWSTKPYFNHSEGDFTDDFQQKH